MNTNTLRSFNQVDVCLSWLFPVCVSLHHRVTHRRKGTVPTFRLICHIISDGKISGRFFCCLLLLCSIGALYPQDSIKTSLYFGNTPYDLYHESSVKNFFSAGGTLSEFTCELQNGDNMFQIGVTRTNLGVEYLDFSSALTFRLASRANTLRAAYSRTMGIAHFAATAEAVETNAYRIYNFSATAGISFNSLCMSSYSLTIARNTAPLLFEALYETESIRLTNPLTQSSITQTYSAGTGNHSLRLTYSTAFSFNGKNTQRMSLDNNLAYNSFCGNYRYKFPNSELDLRLHNIHASTDATLLNEGLSFGNIVLKNADYFKGEIRFTGNLHCGSQYTVSGSYYFLRGSAVGSIESWPFTSVINSLFVNRAYFRASGKAALLLLNGTYTFKTGGIKLIPDFSFLHITPELFSETWQPEFLIFGAKNYTSSRLSLKSAGLLLAGLHCQYSLGKLTGNLDFYQFVPLYSNRRAVAKTGTGTAGEPVPGTLHSDGGRWMHVNLQYSF